MTTGDAADLFGCSVQHLRLLIRNDCVQGVKHGRDWLVERASIERLKEERYRRPEVKVPDEVREQRTLFEASELQPVVNVSTVPQRSPFRYPGGKTWLVPTARLWLASLEEKPRRLLEPFAGGGGIGLMGAIEGYAERSRLVELDPDVAAVWRVMLNDEAAALKAMILDFVCEEGRVREALGAAADGDLERAFQTILRNRVSRGGILAPGAGLVKKGEANKGIASRWYPETLARRIDAIHAHRARIEFSESDGLDALAHAIDDPRTACFVDPPYPVAGKRLYRYHQLDHRFLFERMAALRGPFLATYDDNPEIQALADEFGFASRLIPMKSTHHAKKYELIVSRDLGWLASGEAVPASAGRPRASV